MPCVVLLAAAGVNAQGQAGSGQAYADRGFDHFYNLELEEAASFYQKAIAVEPENPGFRVGLAHVRMFQHLRAAGRLDAQIYGVSNGLLPKPAPLDAKFERAMWEALGHARAICEKRLAANQNDAEAHYALGLAHAVESNFHVNARGKPRDALGPATKAKNHHQRVRELDPANHDANFVIGGYEYAIGSVPGAFRWMLYLLGHSGSKSRGFELIEDAIAHGKRIAPSARVTLAYFHAREKRFSRSRSVLEELTRAYPRNQVFAMEVALSFAREGNHAAAARAYEEVTRKFEAGAPGFGRLVAPRLYFQLAAMHEHAKQYPQAAAAYEKALAAFDRADSTPHSSPGPARSDSPSPAASSPPLARLRAHVLLRLGSILAVVGDKARARLLLGEAAASPYSEVSRAATRRLKNL